MPRGIVPAQHRGERAEALGPARHAFSDAGLPEHTDLPENQGARRIEAATATQKVGGFEALAADVTWVHAQVGEEACVC